MREVAFRSFPAYLPKAIDAPDHVFTNGLNGSRPKMPDRTGQSLPKSNGLPDLERRGRFQLADRDAKARTPSWHMSKVLDANQQEYLSSVGT